MPEVTYNYDSDDLVEEIRERIKRARDHQKEWRDDARDDFEYYAGRQYTDAERAELEEALRPTITFNRIGPVIDAVHGHQLNNIQDVKFLPREDNDGGFAQLYNAAMKWADDESDALDDVADAFMDMIICGMGCTETFLSYDEDPDGKLYTASHVPILEMGWDPNAKKRNILDAKYIFREKWWPRKEAEDMWPKLKEIALKQRDQSLPEDIIPSSHDASQAWRYENDQARYYQAHKDEVRITQYQWWEHKPMYRVMDRESGRIIELDPRRFEKMREFFDMQGVPYVKQMKRTYRQAFLAGDHILEQDDLSANDFTFKFMTGKRDATRNFFFGIVRGMKDPQRWSNKFFAEMQDFMAANRGGGAFVEEDALVNPRKAEEDWNRHDSFILLRPGGTGKIKERQQINYPNGLDRLMQIAISSIPDTSGINLEMLGLVDRNQPGVLETQRKRASINILSHFFASLKRYQRERGKLAIHYLTEFMSDGRLIRVLGDEIGQQLVPLIRNPDHDIKYDIVVDEAPNSPNQKEETFGVLMNLLPILTQLGVPPPPSLLKYVPLPQTLIQEWVESMQQQQPDPLQEARVADTMSRAELNQAKSQKVQAEAQREIGNIGNDEIEAVSKLL